MFHTERHLGLVGRLKLLGLSEEPARIFLALLQRGPMKPGEVSKLLGIGRAETYRLLEDLASRGFVEARLRQPLQYAACSMSKLVSAAVSDEQRRMTEMLQLRTDVEAALPYREDVAPTPIEASYRFVHGRENVVALVRELVRTSTTEVYFSTAHASLARREALLDELQQFADRNGDVRGIVSDAPSGQLPFAFLRPAPAAVSVGRLACFDARDAMLLMTADPSPSPSAKGDVALWTNAREAVGSIRGILAAAWAWSAPPGVDGGFEAWRASVPAKARFTQEAGT